MSWSCPFHSFQLPLHVPDISSVCPCHFPCMSRSFVASHFLTSPVVPIGFIALCFPVIPPALPSFSFLSLSCPFQFPFVSLSFPVAFLACGLFLPSFPCTSLHFPFAPQYSRQNTLFFQRFRKEQSFSRFSLALPCISRHPKTQSFFQIFCNSKQETQTIKKPAGGIEPGTPVLRRLVGRHQIAARYVGGGVFGLLNT